MPVTGLFFIPEINHSSATNTVQSFLDRLNKLHNPTLYSKWAFEHRLYREAPLPPPTSPSVSHHAPPLPSQQPQSAVKTIQVLELSNHAKAFTLAGSSIITIDRDFDTLVKNKMGALWHIRQTLKAQQGDCYEVDDFRVKIAQVFQGQDVKGVLIEVEYTPCQYLAQGEPIIRDFIEQLRLPNAREFFRPKDYNPASAGEDKVFTILDTGRQYMELLRMR